MKSFFAASVLIVVMFFGQTEISIADSETKIEVSSERFVDTYTTNVLHRYDGSLVDCKMCLKDQSEKERIDKVAFRILIGLLLLRFLSKFLILCLK